MLKQLADLRPENGSDSVNGGVSPEFDVTEMDSDKLVINFKVSCSAVYSANYNLRRYVCMYLIIGLTLSVGVYGMVLKGIIPWSYVPALKVLISFDCLEKSGV